jgi:ribosomal 50S subunit-recycling heat shock protein
MNKGISLSSGRYLLFLNSGDTLLNNATIFDIKSIKFNDQLTLHLGQKIIKVRVTSLEMKKDVLMYELLYEEKRP